jgi:3-(3-hydroxy-phenyl)propionate hydroxylase
MTDYDYDVAISGYGPTGQATAALLAQLGHSVCVFESWPSLYGLPRLCTLDGEAARIIQAAADIDHALRDSNPCRRYVLVNEDDQLLIDIDWSADHICGYPLRISMHQPDIEDALDAAAREHGAEINQGWEALGFDQDEDGVTVLARRRSRGEDGQWQYAEERRVRARYLIGADGARSAIRESSGIELEDCGFASAWLSVDALRRRTLPTIQGHSEDIRIPVVTMAPEGRARAVIPIGATRLRFEFWVDPDSDHQEMLSFEVGYDAIERFYGLTADDIEVYRTVVYPFKSKLATTWREGRVFIAGDAAHQMTPFLGQGACSGLRDSINLAWKLDLVLRGVSDERLLDTYEQERKPHVTGHVIGSSELGRVSLELDPEIAAARDAVLLRGEGPPPPPDPVLTAGVLHRGDSGEIELPVGDLGPQGVVTLGSESGRFDDIVGWGFQVIGREYDPAKDLSDGQRRFLEQIHGLTVGISAAEGSAGEHMAFDRDGAYGRYFDQHGYLAIILRPDFTLFGGASSREQLPALIDELQQQLLAGERSLAGV